MVIGSTSSPPGAIARWKEHHVAHLAPPVDLELAAVKSSINLSVALFLSFSSLILSMTSVRLFLASVLTSGKSARRLCELVDVESAVEVALEDVEVEGPVEVALEDAGVEEAMGCNKPEDNDARDELEVACGVLLVGPAPPVVAPILPDPFRAAARLAGPRAANALPSCRRRPAHMQCVGGWPWESRMLRFRSLVVKMAPASPRKSWAHEDEQHLDALLEELLE